MTLWLLGLDHTTAPVHIRERVAFRADQLPEALQQLAGSLFSEATILSTCNRVELYVAAKQNSEDAAEQLATFLASFHGLPATELRPYLFIYDAAEVATHLCSTAAGLRSIVLGEAQIQGQVRAALETAQAAGTAGPVLNRLFRQALAAGRRVRRETAIGAGAASVSQAGVELARRKLGTLAGRCVLLVGSGKVSELAARNLQSYGAGRLLVLNRTFERARELAERFSGEPLPLERLPEALAQADVVISSTSAPEPVISRAQVERALATRAARTPDAPLLLLDLAVPRDVAPEVAEMPGVEVYSVDDLQGIIGTTLERRREELVQAEAIVAEETDEFAAWLRAQDAMPALADLRQQAETLRASELQRAFKRLHQLSPDQRQVVEALSQSLVNRLLHTPTLRMKHAAATGDGARYAAMLRELFALEQ